MCELNSNLTTPKQLSFARLAKLHYRSATAFLQPQPAGTESPSAVIPEASQIRIMTSRTALTSSTEAPLFKAPLRCPFNWGFTYVKSSAYLNFFGRQMALYQKLTSCGIRPARRTKLLSVAVSTLVLLKIYPYISRAAMPRSSVPDLSIWPMTRLETLPYILSKNIWPRWRIVEDGMS